MAEIRFILILTVATSVFSSCEKKEDLSPYQKELQDLEARYEKLKVDKVALSEEKSEKSKVIRSSSPSFRKKLAKMEEALSDANEYVALLESEDVRLGTLLDTWKVAVHESVIGRKIPQLSTRAGEEITDVVITNITEEEVFYDQGGKSASAKLSDLSEESLQLLLNDKVIADAVEEYK